VPHSAGSLTRFRSHPITGRRSEGGPSRDTTPVVWGLRPPVSVSRSTRSDISRSPTGDGIVSGRSQLFPWPARRSLPTGEFADKLRFNGGGDDVSPLRRLALRDASGLGPSGQAVGAHSSSAGLVSTRLRVLDLPLVGRPPDPRLETRLDSEARKSQVAGQASPAPSGGSSDPPAHPRRVRSPQLFATKIASGLDLEGAGSPA
jgi:hypothetical protein